MHDDEKNSSANEKLTKPTHKPSHSLQLNTTPTLNPANPCIVFLHYVIAVIGFLLRPWKPLHFLDNTLSSLDIRKGDPVKLCSLLNHALTIHHPHFPHNRQVNLPIANRYQHG
jgi:hypothetical protein